MSVAKASPEINRITADDRPVHDWYRFVLSYPPHLVREYLDRFALDSQETVLDPFCGTGTTIVECQKMGLAGLGIEANPMAHFACSVKTDWSISPASLRADVARIAAWVRAEFDRQDLLDIPPMPLFRSARKRPSAPVLLELPLEQTKLLLSGSMSPLPLHRTLVLREAINALAKEKNRSHLLLCLAKAVVFSVSNLHFGPEVGVSRPKVDSDALGAWLEATEAMANDLAEWRGKGCAGTRLFHADSRELERILPPQSVGAVITSPPYPNEKDYTRTTRLESVLLGFLRSKEDLRALKRQMLRSNTRGVYKEDTDDRWVADHAEVQRLAAAIEARRIELGKTSGFERMYHRVTKLYFGGMKRHLSELRAVLRPGAKLAYVVGDQASYLRVMIRTGQLLADIAESLGYRIIGIDLFRTRLATATREQLREEVVVLEWPGETTRRVTAALAAKRKRPTR